MFERPLSENQPKECISEVKINGEWKKYGLMSKNISTPYQRGKYLGTSKEIRFDGRIQKPLDTELHFWEKAEEKLP